MNGILHRIEQILEAFKDIGKLSPEQLLKGQRLDPNDEDNFKQVNGRVFYQAISKIRSNDIIKLKVLIH
jgi:hypothetical protein